MGPINQSLVRLFRADEALRGANERLNGATREVRVMERRIADLNERLTLAQSQLREQQTKAAQFELDVQTHDAKIERLRAQQQQAKNHKEYQAFLTEINTEKIDKGKVEEEELKAMEEVEKQQAQIKDLTAQLEAEKKKCADMKAKLASRLAELQADIDRLQPAREEAAKDIPAAILDQFERLCERHEGEAMAAMAKPDRRREEYICGACNMSLVADIYNRLHSRNEPVVCPNCRRMLYIPEDLTPDLAINARPARKSIVEPAAQE